MSGPLFVSFWPTVLRAVLLCGLAFYPIRGAAQVLDLDGDTDRSGKIDGSEKEDSLETQNSVIVINNCDRDNPDPVAPNREVIPDNGDDIVNGNADRKDLEPIILRRAKMLPKDRVKLVLKKAASDGVSLRETVRVFGPDDREILGPASSAMQPNATAFSHELSQAELERLQNEDLTFHVEGLNFATKVKLCVQAGETVHDELVIECAPFIFTPHNLKPVENYVVFLESYGTDSVDYVRKFSDVCRKADVKPVVIDRVGEQWIEDEICWGYTQSPRQRLDLALHMLRLGSLRHAKYQILKPDLGWAPAFDYSHFYRNPREVDSLTFGGNVEVSPPTPEHPFGCLYYGSVTTSGNYYRREFAEQLSAFLKRQGVQPSIELHTNWLAVGHIDELVTFVPKPSGGYVLLVASPAKAFEILDTLPKNTRLHKNYYSEYTMWTVDDIYQRGGLGKQLRQYNEDVDHMLFGASHLQPDPESLVGTLVDRLNLNMDDIVEVPVVFVNYLKAAPGVWAAIAWNPDLVNLSSMGDFVLLGEQFFPPFQKYIEDELQTKIGVKVEWIDNWHLYHSWMGGVHCGSNERRQHFKQNWWDKKQ